MHNDFRCVSCGKRYNFSAGTCGACLRGMVIHDGAESRAERERYEEQQKAQQATAAAEKERANREAARSRPHAPNPLVTPSWNTPLAIVAFIASGIFLASRDLEGGAILIGAGIAAVLAGVFYRLVFAIAGVALVGWILIEVATDDKPRPRQRSLPPVVVEKGRSPGPAPAPVTPQPVVLHNAAQPPSTTGSTANASIGIVDGDPAFATPPGRCIDYSADQRMSCLLKGGEVAYLAGGGTLAYDGGLYIYHYKPIQPNDVSHIEVFTQDDALIAVMHSGKAYYLGPSLAKELQRTLLAYEVKEALILQLPHQPGIGLIESKADAIVRIEVPIRIYSGTIPAHYTSQ